MKRLALLLLISCAPGEPTAEELKTWRHAGERCRKLCGQSGLIVARSIVETCECCDARVVSGGRP